MRYFLEVKYAGEHFNGSQIQGVLPTIQLALNQALTTFLREDIATYGASRTDEGVHARGNVYHFDIERDLPIDTMYRLNALLPYAVSVTNIYKPVNPEANCRFDAVKRSYRYFIHFNKDPFAHKRSLFYPFKIEKELLHQTAMILKKYEHFETFCKRNAQNHTFLCTIFESKWEEVEGGMVFHVTANRFLRGMVRGLVGTQLQVARGRYDIQEFVRRIEANDCTLADFSVPGHGLYLERIHYPQDYFEEK